MIVRNLKYRIIIVVLTVLVLYGIIVKLINDRKFVSLEMIFRQFPFEDSTYETEICIFPKITSNIAYLKPLFKKQPPLTCEYKEADWVTCEKSKCYVKKSILSKDKHVQCVFIDVMFNMNGIYDGAIKAGVAYTLNKSDVVRVLCKSQSNSWSSVLIGIRKDRRDINYSKANTSNVLIIGFPSVSRNTFIQKLPLSYQYLVKVLKGVVLKGYNTVGDNTLSSIYPLLTGKSRKEFLSSNSFFWKNDIEIDDHPFIWHDYKRKGYVTAFLEDFNLWAPIEDRLEGFISMPTDHYIKPYYMAINYMIQTWPKFCSGPLPRYKIFLDYIKAFFFAYKKRKKFLFAFYGELSYNNYNAIDSMDKELLSFLRNMQTSNNLENTLLIIMSDQGYKFSTVRDTLQMKLEENFPFVYIRAPPERAKTAKYMEENLKKNKFALTTPFDLHVTLKNLIYKSYTQSNKSFSLFTKVSKERTCTDAQIDRESCVCLVKKEVDIKSPIAFRLKKVLEYTLNNMTMFLRDTCAALTVSQITNLTRVVLNKHLSYYNDNKDYYIMLAITLPSYTFYEATFLHNLKNDKLLLNHNDIISHDFGLHSYCIKKSYPKLRKFCYCIDQTL